ncbi:MAG: hypothetical protein JSV25_09670 [Spirochaetota bacterium]|nr:MAG: hypothetical protein JSV25_09670 [Spirochaetota bacterium]
MRKSITIAVISLLLGVLLFIYVGCNSTGGAPGSVPTVEETRTVFKGASVGYPPEAEATAFETFFTISFIDLFVYLANVYLEMPGWAGSDGTYTFSYSDASNDFTITLSIVWDAGRGMWHYTLTLDGTLDSIVYSNFKIFDMYASQDGTQGEITFKIPDTPDDYLTVTWNKGDTYITFTMTAEVGSDSFTITLKETIPVFDPVQDQWVSESGRVRIEESGEDPVEVFWGPYPPSI